MLTPKLPSILLAIASRVECTCHVEFHFPAGMTFLIFCTVLILQGKCPNCFVMERQLQSKIVELRDKEVVTIEMQQLCAKMEKQLVQQV